MQRMRNYYRVMLGRRSAFAADARQGNFIGADYGIDVDLRSQLPDDFRAFNEQFIPIWQQKNPGKSKISAGLSCGALWVVAKGIAIGDIVLSPDGQGAYFVGEVTSGYSYRPGEILPHRRTIDWLPGSIKRQDMSDGLRNSAGSIATVSQITKHAAEIDRLIAGNAPATIISTDETVEDATVFALEKHLEDFLVENWGTTVLGQSYNIFSEEGEVAGQQYPTDTGPIDILAVKKDGKELLVVELKKGRATDAVVGQVQRYMGYVKGELLEHGQTVRGVIIALEDDLKLRRALSVTNNIDFYTYKVSFQLVKGGV
jgi:restriction system protein